MYKKPDKLFQADKYLGSSEVPKAIKLKKLSTIRHLVKVKTFVDESNAQTAKHLKNRAELSEEKVYL